MINSNGTNVKTYVGEDGLLHFTDWTGADSVLNFSSNSGNKSYKLTASVSGSKQDSNIQYCNHSASLTVKLSISDGILTITSFSLYSSGSATDWTGRSTSTSKTETKYKLSES